MKQNRCCTNKMNELLEMIAFSKDDNHIEFWIKDGCMTVEMYDVRDYNAFELTRNQCKLLIAKLVDSVDKLDDRKR